MGWAGPRFCSSWTLTMTPPEAGGLQLCPAVSGLGGVHTQAFLRQLVSSQGSQGSQAPAPSSAKPADSDQQEPLRRQEIQP